PPELQREIFETAIRLNRKDAALKLNLSLIAQHVRIWVDWVAYELVTIRNRKSAEKFLKLSDSKAPGFFAIAVKSLLLFSLPAEYTVRILSLCPGVQSLAFWIWNFPTPAIPPISQLPLRRLSVRFCLTAVLTATPPPTWLSSVTHLDIAFFNASESDVKKLTRLPHLTHVALYWEVADAGPPPPIKAVCANCPNLQVLVIMSWPYDESMINSYSFDPRVVVRPVPTSLGPDWEATHLDLPDIWSCAERVLAERNASAAMR
ncbi:hypothetical protein B0H14DRAFT_2362405, partial [Mycena olivaceomarginata]